MRKGIDELSGGSWYGVILILLLSINSFGQNGSTGQGFNAPSVSDSSCHVENTWAAIRNLETAGNLTPGCVYTATNITWILVGGTARFSSIALDENKLADHGYYEGSWNVGHPQEGIINWANGQIEYINERINENEVKGLNTVRNFPFGTTSVQRNKAYHSAFTYTGGVFRDNQMYDAVVVINSGTNNNNVFDNSVYQQEGTGAINNSKVLNLSNLRNGNTAITGSTFNDATTVRTSGSSGSILYSHFYRFLGTNMQNIPSLTLYDATFNAYSQIAANSAARINYLRGGLEKYGRITNGVNTTMNCNYCEASNNSYFDINSGTFTGNEVKLTNQSYIRSDRTVSLTADNLIVENGSYLRGEGTGTNAVTNTRISTGSYVRMAAVTLIGNVVEGYSNIQAYGTSVGYVYYSDLKANSSIAAYNVPTLQLQRSSGASYGRFLFANAARVTGNANRVESYGYMQVYAGDQGTFNYNQALMGAYIRVRNGTLNATSNIVKSSGYIDHNSTGTNTANYNEVQNTSANVRFANTATGAIVSQNTLSNSATIYVRGTSTNSRIYNNNLSIATMDVLNSVSSNIRNCELNSSARMYVYNNPTPHYLYYCSGRNNSEISQRNNTGLTRFYSIDANSQSIWRYTNSAGNGYYSQIGAYFYLLSNAASGTKSGMFGFGRRTLSLANPTPTAPYPIGNAWTNIN